MLCDQPSDKIGTTTRRKRNDHLDGPLRPALGNRHHRRKAQHAECNYDFRHCVSHSRLLVYMLTSLPHADSVTMSAIPKGVNRYRNVMFGCPYFQTFSLSGAFYFH